ncbi:UNVERIFIED_CONTAM: hypothetical protein Scaly_2797300 [Sesamum calycinum]|uniref:Uncharacterized protein n=1 Tax=Sesamum calycinum TaxID=2727403 RepID=A0AAW2IWI6_9LAMI
MKYIKVKVKAPREKEKATLDRIEVEYKEQLAGLRREAEVKGQKLDINPFMGIFKNYIRLLKHLLKALVNLAKSLFVYLYADHASQA